MNNFYDTPIPLSELGHAAFSSIPEAFLGPLSPQELDLVVAAYITLDEVTRGKKAPRLFQLKVMLSTAAGRDCIVRAATSSGKTLAMMLAHLVFPEDVVITISPLKILQTAQVDEFNAYGIRSVAINEDTVLTPKLYQEIRSGVIKHIITSPEQLTVIRGHVPLLARLMHERTFTARITRVNVDEAHFIPKTGFSKGTDPPFRVAYSKIGELRVLLGRRAVFVAVSATMPADVAQSIKTNLHMQDSNTDTIMLSSNRPNLTYGVVKMIGSLKNFSNVRFVVPTSLTPASTLTNLKKGVIFIENKLLTSQTADYLNSLLPAHLRKLQPFRHIHSSMSQEYNTRIYADFSKPDGTTKCIVATSTAAHGLDVKDLRYAASYGVTESLLDLEQKLGRAGRDGITQCFAITIAEPWAYEIGGDSVTNAVVNVWTKTRSKQLRTEQPVRQLVLTEDCRREFLKEQNHDTSSTALDYTNPVCCDSPVHLTDFKAAFRAFFESDLAVDLPPEPKQVTQQKRRGGRLKVQRPELEKRIRSWRKKIHDEDEDYIGFPIGYILSAVSLDDLVAARPKAFESPQELQAYINETDEWANEWAEQLYNIIRDYDSELAFAKLLTTSGTGTASNSGFGSGNNTSVTHEDADEEPEASSSTNNPPDFSSQALNTHDTLHSLDDTSTPTIPPPSNYTAAEYDKAKAYVMQLMSNSQPATEDQENIPRSLPASPGPSRPAKRRRTALKNTTNAT